MLLVEMDEMGWDTGCIWKMKAEPNRISWCIGQKM